MNEKIGGMFLSPTSGSIYVQKSLDELLEKDRQREEDGFPKKIRLGKFVKPSKDGKKKIVVIPRVEEEKFIHDTRSTGARETETGGAGEGKEGDVIGEEPIHTTQGEGTGAGEGDGGSHEVESNAYDLGKTLSEKFELPNIKDKKKKKTLARYVYDLTDRNRGFGQVLDKKATLKKVIETNMVLGNIPDVTNIKPDKLLVSPNDKIYRILSREKEYESQALVFFVRDYSGSMYGSPTELVVSQHLFIYTWLMYQYKNNVKTRFVLHDTDAKEVEDFYTYYNSSIAGGTKISSAYKLVNKIIHEENLHTDYNIYLFHGTDGDDWGGKGEETIAEMKKMLSYVNRIGITAVARFHAPGDSTFEKYLNNSGILKNEKIIRLDSLKSDSDEERIIEGIKNLIS